MEYILHLFILISFYTILSQSLNLISGSSGLISLAHAGFYGIGAYVTALLSVNYGFSFWINVPIAMGICGFVAFVVSLISLRSVNDYFIVCTLGIQVILFSLMNNLIGLTRGPFGIIGIPAISIFGFVIVNKGSFLFISILFMISVWYLLNNISKSGFGKSLVAVSEDEIYTQSIGKNVYKMKIISFTIGSVLAVIPGALYAHYISYIDPTSFTISESIFILSIVIIGGMGNLRGSLYASAFMILLPELLRFIGMADNIAANMRQIIYGLLLVIIILKNGSVIKKIVNIKLIKSPS